MQSRIDMPGSWQRRVPAHKGTTDIAFQWESSLQPGKLSVKEKLLPVLL